jgi:hypothetical protein
MASISQNHPDSVMDGVAEFNGHYYKVFTEYRSWSDAKAECERMGGYLACISSMEENEFICNLATSNAFPVYTCAWIGAWEDVQSSEWKWINGERVTLEENMIIDVSVYENRLNLRLATGKWEDYAECGESPGQQWFVCEWDLIPDSLDDSSVEDETAKNGPQLVEGISGKAYRFDGDGDYINIDNSQSLSITGDQITISAWISAERIDRRQVIVSKTAWGDNTWLLETNPIDFDEGTLNFYMAPGWGNSHSRTAIEPDKWYHVVCVYDGSMKRIYINGVLDSSDRRSGYIPANDQPVRIASWGDPIGPNETRFFKGTIDEVAIFNRALSPEEIQHLYTAPGSLEGSTEGLVGYWTFDNDDGNLVIDSSPYKNNGIIRKEIGPYPTTYHYPY